MCDDSTVVASVSLQDGTVSCFPLLVDGRLFGVVRVSRPHLPQPGQFLCSGGFLLDRRDPIMGSEWLFSVTGGSHSPVRLGFPVV